MVGQDQYHVLINEAIERLKTEDTFGVMLLNIANSDGGYLEIAITKEQHRMDAWRGVFHGDRHDPRYCASTLEEVAADFDAIRFDTKNLIGLEEFAALMGTNFQVKRFVDADHQFIGMSDDRLVLFHISDDWDHARETAGHHVSLSIN